MELGKLLISIVTALAVIASAWWLKDTEYENTWLYIFSAHLFIIAALDVYSAYSKRKKGKDQ